MQVVMFYHSLVSDWNHGNAHFLRGVVRELLSRGHSVRVYEPADNWSLSNLLRDHGVAAVREFHAACPNLKSTPYTPGALNLDSILEGADLVLVHEWNDPALVQALGRHRARARTYKLLFHDTHHRAVTAPEQMAQFDLTHFDGVLAFGDMLRQIYLERGWTQNAWTWHEAADTAIFRPLRADPEQDLVWVGNWGDEERTANLHRFLFQPIKRLRLKAAVYGVRYPDEAREVLRNAKVSYRGWLANYRVPEVFARCRMTVHIPRRPYTEHLKGIPTIRVFEALACGVPLVSSPWEDTERLFRPGEDFLIARTGKEMREHMQLLLNEPAFAQAMARRGRRQILNRHTCGHRVDQLLAIAAELGVRDNVGVVA